MRRTRYRTTLMAAVPEHSAVASRLLYLSMAPLADYWMGVQDGAIAHGILERMFRERGNLFSHEFAEMALVDEDVAGLELSYPARLMRSLEIRTLLMFVAAAGALNSVRMVVRSFPLQSITQADAEAYFLAHLAVLPKFEGRGLGRRLLQRSVERAIASDHGRITLTVDAANERAIALYSRAGFAITSTSTFEHLSRRFGYHGYHHMTKALK